MITSVAIAAFLTLFPSCICSEIKLVETGGGIKTPGNDFNLICTAFGFSVTDYGVNWIRQVTGKAPQWMGVQWGGGSIDYNPALRSRITITRDPAKRQSYLRVNDASEHDSGTYYCAIQYGTSTVVSEQLLAVQKASVNRENTQGKKSADP
uniref:Ig-like domain-containing protein n=1 Tax=Anolis carolinensis TaxID=28377 RepID=H9GQ29_ANOCA